MRKKENKNSAPTEEDKLNVDDSKPTVPKLQHELDIRDLQLKVKFLENQDKAKREKIDALEQLFRSVRNHLTTISRHVRKVADISGVRLED